MTGLRGAVDRARETMRARLWPVPTAGVLVAVVLGIGLPRLDARVDGRLAGWFGQYLFGGDAGAARTVLDAVASSLITVTSLTFSLTVVTLQLASGQFSPRLLRTFTRDLFVQATLALFLGTFVYALTVLRSVRSEGTNQTPFVPSLSVTVGFVLAVASVLGLVLFLAHLARQIRVETMLKNVHADASATARHIFSADNRRRGLGLTPPEPPTSALPVLAPGSGFLVSVAVEELIKAAAQAEAVVMIEPFPGDPVVAGTPFAWVWRHGGDELDRDTLRPLTDSIHRAVSIGFERTNIQDIAFGLRQMTDVANKALSPGINDPTTAVHALGHSAAFLCEVADRELGPEVFVDRDGATRVVLRRPDLADLLELAVQQPRRYGACDPAVLAQIYRLLRQVAWVAGTSGRASVQVQLDRLDATAAAQNFDGTERDRLKEMANMVTRAIRDEWPG